MTNENKLITSRSLVVRIKTHCEPNKNFEISIFDWDNERSIVKEVRFRR